MRDGYAEDVSLLYSEHILVAMCAERNAGLARRPYRLLLIFSLRAHHNRVRR